MLEERKKQQMLNDWEKAITTSYLHMKCIRKFQIFGKQNSSYIAKLEKPAVKQIDIGCKFGLRFTHRIILFIYILKPEYSS